MIIVKSRHSDVDTLKGWFPDRESTYLWGGPTLRFPFVENNFLEDIRWSEIPSYSMLDSQACLAGFGQYYEKSGRCHLARLAISPALRGTGQGKSFIARLMAIGLLDLDVQEASLFVASRNSKALHCYHALGFNKEDYPVGQKHFEGIDYMVLKSA